MRMVETDGLKHAFHFKSARDQYEAAKLGMWLFLATEILFFGVMFTAYFVFKALYPELYAESNAQLNRVMGGINTLVLITSSYTAVLAVLAAKRGDNAKVKLHLWLTIAFACVFAVIKYFEYTSKFSHDIYPSTNIFFGLYFTMTGIHMAHVFIGMGVLFWALLKANKGEYSPDYYTPVELGALLWHLVDLIWIFVFPIIYLIG